MVVALALSLFFYCINTGNGIFMREDIGKEAFVTRDEFNTLIGELRGKVNTMQIRVSNLEHSLLEKNKLNSALKNRINELEKENVKMKIRITNIEKTSKSSEDRLENFQPKKGQSRLLSQIEIVELFDEKLSSTRKQANRPLLPKHDNDKEEIDDDAIAPNRTSNDVNEGNNSRTKPGIPLKQATLQADSHGVYDNLHELRDRQITEPNESVAFSVFINHDDITGLAKSEVIKFNGVILNDGNGYDVTTGIFTAPRGGLYLFSFFIEDYHDQDLWVELLQDNVIRAQAVAEPYTETQNTMGGNTVLLHVKEGSSVWLSIYRGDRVQKLLSTFSGVLLH